MKNLLRFFSMMIMCGFWSMAYGQPGPVCTDLNIPVGPDDSATIVVGNFVPNADASIPDITIENPYGGVIRFVENATATTEIRIGACAYVGRELKLVAKNANGSCWSKITFKQNGGPIIVGTSTTVFCTDPLVQGGHVAGAPPLAAIPCSADIPSRFVSDWVVPYDCVLGNDTAKIIYRMYEAYDKNGVRGTGFDTIVVYRLPLISANNTQCIERDTTYCGVVNNEPFGPYMVVTDPVTLLCDTIYFLKPNGTPADIDPKCGLAIAVEKEDFGNAGCTSVTKYTVSLKQTCYGTDPGICVVTPPGTLVGQPGYYTCTFWLMDLDTFPPVIHCDLSGANVIDDIIYVPTGNHDCAAHTYLPPAIVSDSCHDIKQVKAMIAGYGGFAFTRQGNKWVNHTLVKLPLAEEPIQVIYEALDECHNVSYDTCYIKVKDYSKPIAVCDKGVNVSLTGKKIWVNAETFDEGSWDNCGINTILVRRSDWKEACVDFCDSTIRVKTTHYGSIYRPYLESDKSKDEVQAHYQKTMDWLAADGQACGNLIFQAWRYDLMKHATVYCEGEMDAHRFDQEVQYLLDPNVDFDQVKQIGGGWAEDVLFSCDDACGKVTVEILVMDYWCNWSRCWTDVWVEDKTPISIPKDVTPEVDITCKTYRTESYTLGGSPISIEGLIAAADAGNQMAFNALDDIFGGYQKAWLDAHGNYVDENGEVLDCEIEFTDSTCYCSSYYRTEYELHDHLGWIPVEKHYRVCEYDDVEEELSHGVITVNCATNVNCVQDIWYEFDHCGQGVIYRKFKIWQGCPTTDLQSSHRVDTIIRIQKIWVGNECELDEGMFSYPADVTVDACGIVYDTDRSGNVGGVAHPDVTGRPEYLFDDDCRIVGIGYYDKVFRVVGGDEACFKIVRTWCFADWCEIDKPVGDSWLVDPEYSHRILKYQQKIILRDTVPPSVTITPLPGGTNSVSAGGCEYNYATTVSIGDACGVLAYRWTLSRGATIVKTGSGSLDLSVSDDFAVSANGLTSGTYVLRVISTDECQNEGVASYTFIVTTGQKPSPVCITSITVELTPTDLDNDGVIDTGFAVIWAEEFNSSSAPACSDDSVAFYLEFIDGIDDGTIDPEDADSLLLGCDVLPDPFMVRLWVKSFPSGTSDYCDVYVVPQNNMAACGDISAAQSSVSGSITTELSSKVEKVNVVAKLSNGQEISNVTNASGTYGFAAALGLNVSITPKKDTEHLNGISTADMIQIQKHILGKELLANNYREIAADVNNDGKISALDLLSLRRLILGTTDKLPNGDSWKFINKVNGKEGYTINGLSQRQNIDFVGIKIGDVNLSNDPSRSAGRNASDLQLVIEDQEILSGGTYKVDVLAGNFQDIEGYQFTFQVDPSQVKITNVTMGTAVSLNEDNFSFSGLNNGMFTTSWNQAEAITLQPDEVLFTIELAGLTESVLSNAIAVTSAVTAAEAYKNSEEVLGVAVRFNGQKNENGFALYQNRPNPFKQETNIGFVLPESSAATISVYDVTGKVLKVIEGDFVKGYNEVMILKSDLNVTGVLYYQLDSETFTATRKMVILD